MLIDWFTVGAQALNFVILVGLMKHFLYQPVLKAIDAREARVAAALADAAARQADAGKERDDLKRKTDDFDQKRAALLADATTAAGAERQRLLDEARKTAEAVSAKRQDALRREAGELQQAVSRRTQDEVFAISRKALTDLASASLEARLCDVFVRRLRDLDAAAKEALGAALKGAPDAALVRSAFDLPAEQRAAIQSALAETFGVQVVPRFETAPDLIGGIELSAQGVKLAWSIADYLTSLQKSVTALLAGPPVTAPATDGKSPPATGGETASASP
jgi:F-type H+-transporting ATPase subunit b